MSFRQYWYQFPRQSPQFLDELPNNSSRRQALNVAEEILDKELSCLLSTSQIALYTCKQKPSASSSCLNSRSLQQQQQQFEYVQPFEIISEGEQLVQLFLVGSFIKGPVNVSLCHNAASSSLFGRRKKRKQKQLHGLTATTTVRQLKLMILQLFKKEKLQQKQDLLLSYSTICINGEMLHGILDSDFIPPLEFFGTDPPLITLSTTNTANTTTTPPVAINEKDTLSPPPPYSTAVASLE